MLVVGNTDAHLKNWALIYPDGLTPRLAPLYDFHSLTVYDTYRYAPLALSLAGEVLPSSIHLEHFRHLADRVGTDASRTADTVQETVEQFRSAWAKEMAAETRERYPALAEHYARRLDTLPLCRATI